MTQISTRVVLALAAVLAVGCADPPAAPTPEPVPREPEPSAVTAEAHPTTARVGGIVTLTYRLTPPLDRPVAIWTEVTPPRGASYETSIDFPAGETTRVYTTGYLSESTIGTTTVRIRGDRLPDGVVLGNPSAYTFTVVE